MPRSTRAPAAALLILCACTTSNLGNQAELATTSPGTAIAGEFIIAADVQDSVLHDLGLEKVDYDNVLGAGLYRTEAGVSLTALRTQLRQSMPTDVEVEENRVVAALSNDPYRTYQWNLDMMQAEQVWTTSTGAGIVVAVIDTGVATFGEDAPLNFVSGWDYVGNDADPTDENGHGTHVAGTIAQASNNGLGVAGLAPNAAIMPIRVLDRNGSGSVYWSAKGIRFAADNGADVINLSLGSPYSSGVDQAAIDHALSLGVVVVAASGNAGKSTVDYPAAYPDVIAVGAVGGGADVTAYSNRGSALDVVAPGGDLSRDQTGDGYADGILQETLSGAGTSYQFFEGTSMATPHVAAAAAILLAAGADSSEVAYLLTSTATDLEGPGWDSTSGYGLIDPLAALAQVGGSPAPGGPGGGTEPTPDTTAPVVSNVTGTRNGTSMTLNWTTDEPTSTEIEFRDYGLFGDPNALETSHQQQFTVDANTTYYFTIVAVDEAGNRTESGEWYLSP